MAHFAQVDTNWVVLQVITIDNSILLNSQGIECDWLGEQFCQQLYGMHTKWIQTSFNGRKYKNFAGIGYTFDTSRHAFIPPKPFASWTLNESTCRWQSPKQCPQDGRPYEWDEDKGDWIPIGAPLS